MDIETREHFWNLIEQLKEDGITILYTLIILKKSKEWLIKLSI